MSENDIETPASSINTVLPDRRPTCPLTSGEELLSCSASHDNRFAIAVTSEKKIGIDVEEISDRAIKSQKYYMS